MKTKHLCATLLGDKTTQLWSIDQSGKIWSCWSRNIGNSGQNWNTWTGGWIANRARFIASNMSASQLAENTTQLWAVDNTGKIWSCWKGAPHANWNNWTRGWISTPPTFTAKQVAASELGGEVSQVWAVDRAGKIWSCWKRGANSKWNDFTQSWINRKAGFQSSQVVASKLGGNVSQVWAVDRAGKIWSCWKGAPNASWNDWTEGWITNRAKFKAQQVSVCQLGANVTQVWAVDTSGNIWSCWKGSPNARWNDWTLGWIAERPSFSSDLVAVAQLGSNWTQVWALSKDGFPRSCWKGAPYARWNDLNLFFTMQRQTQTQWCWSAVSTSTSHYFNHGSPWTQCSLANEELSQTTCCRNGGTSGCNKPWYLNYALATVGNFDRLTGVAEPYATIESENTNGRPLGARIGWNPGVNGSGHFMMLTGTGTSANQIITVKDPIYGTSYISYNTFKNNYQGINTARWTTSYFTKE